MPARILLGACVLSLTLACERIPRLDVPTAAEVHHLELQKVELPRCAERLAAIRKELQGLEDHPWAGEYSWSLMQWCGSCPQHAETIAIAPHAGVVWWYQGRDLEGAHALDQGEILSVDDDRIVVRWAIDSVSPHVDCGPRRGRLMSAELTRVKWGSSELLVPSVRMPAFCGSVSAGADSTLVMFPRRGGWRRGYSDAEEPARPAGWPRVPLAWEDYLVRSPIRALAELDGSAELDGAYGPETSADRGERWHFMAHIPAGRAQGVRPGMLFYAQEPTNAGDPDRDLQVGEVDRLEEGSAWLTFTGWISAKNGPLVAHQRFTMSTRKPSPLSY